MSAQAAVPEGTWMISNRVAIEVLDCSSLLCGRIAWLRNPALRTTEMCGRTISVGANACWTGALDQRLVF